MQKSTDSLSQEQQKILSFRVAGQDYCIDIVHVREIRRWTEATTLPKAPEYIKGVINLRGNVIPVVDLSQRLGHGPTSTAERNVIINAVLNGGTVGLLVEEVSDILSVSAADMQPTPEIASDSVREIVDTILQIGDRLIRGIALENILPRPEVDLS